MERNKNEEVIIIPYEKFYLTQPINKNDEVGIILNNIFAKISMERNEDGEVEKYLVELIDKNGIKIGSSENGERFKADLEIITSLIQNQQRKLKELMPNLSVAGADSLDNQGRIESFIELYNRELITMNKNQKEQYDQYKADYERSINDIARDNVEGRRDKKEELDKNVENMEIIKNQENAALVRSIAEQDLGFKVSKITPIEDSLFYENNPEVVKGKAFFIVDDKRKSTNSIFRRWKIQIS